MSDDRDLQEPVEAKVYITPAHLPSRTEETERTPLQSKKFISYFISDLMWKGVILTMVLAWNAGEINQVTMIVAILASMVVQLAYIFTQGWIDKHVRVARITKKNNNQK